MNGSLVSIILPVYNGERFLAAALDSVFAQDYHPFEVIVVDDGSGDGSASTARSFSDVRYVYHDHQGLAQARNVGIAAAKGEFVAFHDADDLMPPKKLSTQVGYLMAHQEVGCVLARQEVFLEAGIELPGWLQRDRVYGDLGGVPPMTAVVRRGVLERVGGFDATYQHSADTDWLFRMRSAGVEIAVVPQILLRRRIHSGNMSHENRAMGQNWLRSLKDKIDRRRAGAP
jgi:glycosyltransferase involved in cell wall biosynthesis